MRRASSRVGASSFARRPIVPPSWLGAPDYGFSFPFLEAIRSASSHQILPCTSENIDGCLLLIDACSLGDPNQTGAALLLLLLLLRAGSLCGRRRLGSRRPDRVPGILRDPPVSPPSALSSSTPPYPSSSSSSSSPSSSYPSLSYPSIEPSRRSMSIVSSADLSEECGSEVCERPAPRRSSSLLLLLPPLPHTAGPAHEQHSGGPVELHPAVFEPGFEHLR